MSQTRIIAVANMKGGVGKTTTSINLAACLADRDKRTLVVDLDPQANATSGLGIDPQSLNGSIYDILMEDLAFEDCIEGTSVKGLFILPSNPNLSGAEVELANAYGREHRLEKALENIVDDYEYIFIDCPPSLGLLTVNALTFATEVLIPIQCEYFALEGLGQLLENMELIREHLNPDLQLRHIVLVMFNASTNLSRQVEEEVRGRFTTKVCKSVVPRSVSLAEAPKTGLPINKFSPSSKGAIAYREVAKEIDTSIYVPPPQDLLTKTQDTENIEKESVDNISGIEDVPENNTPTQTTDAQNNGSTESIVSDSLSDSIPNSTPDPVPDLPPNSSLASSQEKLQEKSQENLSGSNLDTDIETYSKDISTSPQDTPDDESNEPKNEHPKNDYPENDKKTSPPLTDLSGESSSGSGSIGNPVNNTESTISPHNRRRFWKRWQ